MACLEKLKQHFFGANKEKQEEIWLAKFIIGKHFQPINIGRTSIALPMNFSFVLPSHTSYSQFGLPLLVTGRTILSLTNKKQPFVNFKSHVSNQHYWCSCFNETTLWLIYKIQRCTIFSSYIKRAREGSQCIIVHIKS